MVDQEAPLVILNQNQDLDIVIVVEFQVVLLVKIELKEKIENYKYELKRVKKINISGLFYFGLFCFDYDLLIG